MNCFSCNTLLPKGVNFCPGCGVAAVHNILIEEKSTANFDPLSRNFKPWRDLPLVPKRTYKVDDKKAVAAKLPWCPPMRQLRPRTKKIITKPVPAPSIVVPEKPLEEEPIGCKDETPATEESIEAAPLIQFTPTGNESLSRQRLQLISLRFSWLFPVNCVVEKASPIAVYDALWLPSTSTDPAATATVVNMSLVEHSTSATNRHYWLRVGVLSSGDEDASAEGEDGDRALQVLCYLSNEAARLMFARASDWVDLFAVSGLFLLRLFVCLSCDFFFFLARRRSTPASTTW